MNNNIILAPKFVGDISGKYFIPSYQRGYRWGKEEVERLLDDIYTNGDKNYCLQPVVVRRRSADSYELIDGQQRLTSLFIILKYMKRRHPDLVETIDFSLEYETREHSGAFLNDIELSQKNKNIDFFFICQAYETVENWFDAKVKSGLKHPVVANHLYTYFCENVKVIWYEVGDNVDPIALFTRLNIGKIPLTSAELVKAMFLSTDNNKGMTEERQNEISMQWDSIERQLNDNSLWCFLTNNAAKSYSTRIDLILDLMSNGGLDEMEKYHTFFYFNDELKTKDIYQIWEEIQQCFLILKDWFENHELYHKIGYLIASESQTLRDLYINSLDKTKSAFRALLDSLISASINFGGYSDLNYESATDYPKIMKILLLFNVISVMKNGEQTQWFPFDKFKFDKDSRTGWSLEHIHAQQSQGLKTQNDWFEWLKIQLPSLNAVAGDEHQELINEVKEALEMATIERKVFESIQARVIFVLSDGKSEYLHTLANLALLNTSDNAALNNSTFDVKRNAIIDLDKKGRFIPFCTKMVFLKYYTQSDQNQLHFRGEPDRKAYIEAMNTVLKEYLVEKIEIGAQEK